MTRIFVLLLLVLHEVVNARPLDVSVSAQSAIIINAENGKVLFAKNIDEPHPPGSTTKIATGLVALQHSSHMDEQVQAHPECLIYMSQQTKQERGYQDPPYLLEPDGMSCGIHIGDILTVKKLLRGLLLSSGNDAANVLAYHFSQGDIPAYVEEMNRYVRSIGCRNTTFYNPHGLHYPGHLTTARDLATLGREAIQHPEYLEAIGTACYTRPHRPGKHYHPTAFCIKYGYHEAGGYALVAVAQEVGRVVIAAVLHVLGREEVFTDVVKLFEAAFAEKQVKKQLFSHETSVFSASVEGAQRLLKAGVKEDVFIEYFPSEEEEVVSKIIFYDVKLPIQQGDHVGEVQVHTETGVMIKSVPIYAIEEL